MQAKKFIAPNMREGLKQVRDTFGDNAMILSNKTTSFGIEIIASLPEVIEGLSNNAQILLQAQKRTKQEELLDNYKREMIEKPLLENRHVVKDNPRVKVEQMYSENHVLEAVQSELRSIKTILSSQLQDLCWSSYATKDAFKSQVAKHLVNHGVSQERAMSLANSIVETQDLEKAYFESCMMFIRDLKLATYDESQQMIALVGPGGAGKTRSLGKVASHWLNILPRDQLALVSYNENRLGAQDALMIYGHIYQVAAMMCADSTSLEQALTRIHEKRRVYIDATTLDREQSKVTMKIMNTLPFMIQSVGVLPANLEYHAMKSWMFLFKEMNVKKLWITKMDEAFLKAQILDLSTEYDFSIEYVFQSPTLTESVSPISGEQLMEQLRGIYAV